MKVYLVFLTCYLLDMEYPQTFVQKVYLNEEDAKKYVDNFTTIGLPVNKSKPYKLEIKPYEIIEKY